MRMQMSEFQLPHFHLHLTRPLSPSFRRLRGVRAEGERDGERVPGHEQAVPHRLLRLLLLRQDAPRKGLLQRQREDLLRGGLHGSCALFCLAVADWIAEEELLLYFQYSGFQQTSEKCGMCGHLIMEMVTQILEAAP